MKTQFFQFISLLNQINSEKIPNLNLLDFIIYIYTDFFMFFNNSFNHNSS